MTILFQNNATGTLKTGITDSETAIELTTGHGDRFPVTASPDYFYATFEDASGNKEIVKITARASGQDTMTIVRAQESTSAQAWLALDVFELRITAGVYQSMVTDTVQNAADMVTLNATVAALSSFDAGTKMYFYQNTAPTDWTFDSGVVDTILGIKGGSDAYNVNGGNQAGTWTQPDHILTTTEMPAHDHTISAGYYGAGSAQGAGISGSTGPDLIRDTGGGAAHNHGTTYRPLAAVGIIATKD